MDNRIRKLLPRRAKSGASADAFDLHLDARSGPTSPTFIKHLARSSVSPSYEEHGLGLRSISYETVVAGKPPTFGLTPQKGNGPVKLQTSRRLSSGEVMVTSQDPKRTFEDIREGDYIVGGKERRESQSQQRDRSSSSANLYQPLHNYDRELRSPRTGTGNWDLAPTSPRLAKSTPLPSIPIFEHDHFDDYEIDYRIPKPAVDASNHHATPVLEPVDEHRTVPSTSRAQQNSSAVITQETVPQSGELRSLSTKGHRQSLSTTSAGNDDGSEVSMHKRLSFISSNAGSSHCTNRTSVTEADMYNPREEISKLIEDMRKNYIKAYDGESQYCGKSSLDGYFGFQSTKQKNKKVIRPSMSYSTMSVPAPNMCKPYSRPHGRHQSWSASASPTDSAFHFPGTAKHQSEARSVSQPTDLHSTQEPAVCETFSMPTSGSTVSAVTMTAVSIDPVSEAVATPTSATMPATFEEDGGFGLKRADSTTLGSLLDAEIKRSSIATRRKTKSQSNNLVNTIHGEPESATSPQIQCVQPPPRPAPPPFLWDDTSETSFASEPELEPETETGSDSLHDSVLDIPSDMLFQEKADDDDTTLIMKNSIVEKETPMSPQIAGLRVSGLGLDGGMF